MVEVSLILVASANVLTHCNVCLACQRHSLRTVELVLEEAAEKLVQPAKPTVVCGDLLPCTNQPCKDASISTEAPRAPSPSLCEEVERHVPVPNP